MSVKSFSKKLLIFFLAFYALLFAVLYLGTPHLVRHFAKQPLSDLGLSLDSKSHVKYNLITSTLSIDDLILLDASNQEAASVSSLDISVHLHKLLFKRVHIANVHFDGGHLNIEKRGDALIVAGVNLSELPKGEEQIEEPTDQTAEPSDFRVTLDELLFENFALNSEFDGYTNSFSLDQFKLEGLSIDANNQTLSFELQSQLDGSEFNLGAEFALEDQQGDISIDVDLKNLALTNYSHLVADENLSLAGELSIQGSPSISLAEQEISVYFPELLIDLNQVQAKYADWLYKADQHNIDARDLKIGLNTDTNDVDVESAVELEFLAGQVSIGDEQNVLAAWDSIQLNPEVHITPNTQNISIEQLATTNVHLSKLLDTEQAAPIALINALELNQIAITGNSLEIESVVLTEGTAALHVLEDKTIENMVDLSLLSAPSPTAESPTIDSEMPSDDVEPESLAQIDTESETAVGETTTEQSAEAFSIKLGELRFASPFVVSIADESVTPAYTETLNINEFTVGTIDSTNPEGITPITLKVKNEEYFALDLAGDVSPFGEQLNASIAGSLTELTLSDVSPYVKDALGFEMKSGQLDIELDLQIEQNELAGDTRLIMRGLDMTKSNDYEQGTIKEGQAMPLNAALGMLKDDQGNIDLNVPMTGDISDPSFGLSGILTLVLKKAAMNQAKTYLVQTFVPYANVVTVVMSGADYVLQLRLEPLVYEPTQADFSSTQQVYIDELVQLLNDKPDVQVKTCAISTTADLGLSNEVDLSEEQTLALVALGEERQNKLKSYLVEQGQVPSSRVLSCATEIDRSDEASPRIELKTD